MPAGLSPRTADHLVILIFDSTVLLKFVPLYVLYVNFASPVQLLHGVKLNDPSGFNVNVPRFAAVVVTRTVLSGRLNGSVSFANTPGAAIFSGVFFGVV
jgi:hypothetical protein